MHIKELSADEKGVIKDVVSIHMKTFTGFFLTFLGKGFLDLMYCSYTEHRDSGVLVAFDENRAVGFLAYSRDFSGFFKYMIKRRLILFAWYSLGAFVRKPTVFMRLLRALLKPGETKREEKYVELASIGVDPEVKSHGVGSKLIDELKSRVDFNEYAYIALETDAVNNEGSNYFYKKNGFVLEREFTTAEGRRMNEYRFEGKK